MKQTFKLKTVLLVAICFMFTGLAQAQMGGTAKPLASPRDSISGTVNGANIHINYGSPSVRGRKIWGALVPYDSVWRAGANEATRFTTDKDIHVQGQVLPAGTYGFFIIPKAPGKKWVIIFNSVPNQWGAFKYDKSRDVLRVTVAPKPTTSLQERLVYTVSATGVTLTWENVNLPLLIE